MLNECIEKHVPFVWGDMKEARKEYLSKKICPCNKIEFLWLALTDMTANQNEYDICEYHIDKRNDKDLSEVVILSTVDQPTM